MHTSRVVLVAVIAWCVGSSSHADLTRGVISDFQDGTVQGWGGGTVSNQPNTGPLGAGDHSLQLSNGGFGGFFAMHNTGVNGSIDPAVSAVTADILRPLGVGAAEIRFVLFDTGGTKWTSTLAATIVDDGNWHRYTFSILEADLTRVDGLGSYANLTGNLERIMFRYDPGAPSPGGASLPGTMNFDNVTAIPEPSVGVGVVLGSLALCISRRARRKRTT